MTKRLLAALLLTAAAGCGGGGLCDNFENTASSTLSKAQPCFSGTTPIALPSKTQCNAAISACTDADRQKLQQFLDCLNTLPTCSTANQSSWTNQLDACETTAHTGISVGCAEATGV